MNVIIMIIPNNIYNIVFPISIHSNMYFMNKEKFVVGRRQEGVYVKLIPFISHKAHVDSNSREEDFR